MSNVKAHAQAPTDYHSEDNLRQLHDHAIPALIADGLMRRRDVRFKEQGKYKALPDPIYDKSKISADLKQSPSVRRFTLKDFHFDLQTNTCICPAGKSLYSNGSHCTVNGRTHHKFTGAQRLLRAVSTQAAAFAHT
ncbi:hypothetical protein LP417_17535 [Polaromonas sp. P1-6]|nr:hypothetical protein LP417_17535 [Polaromonas sp. P1-6]